MWKGLFIAVFLCLSAAFAKAETKGSLSGLKQFQLLIDLTRADFECGVTEDLVRQVFMNSAAFQKFKIVASSTVAFYVKITTLHTPTGICMSVTDVDLRTAQNVQLAFSGEDHFVRLLLWSNGWFDMSPNRNAHKQHVKKTLEDAARLFSNDWNLANN